MASLEGAAGGAATGATVAGPYGALVGGVLGAFSGGDKKPAGSAGGGAAPQAPDVQSSTQSTNQTVTNNISVGDFGESTRALLPFIGALPSPYTTPSGYSAEAFLSGRSPVTTYALVALLGLFGVVVYKKALR